MAWLLVGCANNRPTVIVITTNPDEEQQTISSSPVSTAYPTDIAPTTIIEPLNVSNNVEDQYIVQSGDTLSTIAASYGISLQTLIITNQITNPDLLEVGQVILIPKPPTESTPFTELIPNSRLVRSLRSELNIELLLSDYNSYLSKSLDTVPTRQADGSERNDILSGFAIVERVSLEYSVDPRLLVTFLEYRAKWVSQSEVPEELVSYPLINIENSSGFNRSGLYRQLSWLANELNRGYYGRKYRDFKILDFVDGTRLNYREELSAGTIALQYVLAISNSYQQWSFDVNNGGFIATYKRLFGDPFANDFETIPDDLLQPNLDLPFQQNDVWRFTGGVHGGWGSGSAWAALDFAPPDKPEDVNSFCYTSQYAIVAVASGYIVRISNGAIVLDLDGDGNESTGWSILYLHVSADDSLREGQLVEAGEILGYASCYGGFSTATHLHIARRYNGEWIPADCMLCSTAQTIPNFVMSNWRAVGLENQEYQGFMVNDSQSKQIVAEQTRGTNINEISR